LWTKKSKQNRNQLGLEKQWWHVTPKNNLLRDFKNINRGTPHHHLPWRNGSGMSLQKQLMVAGASTHMLIVNFCYYPAGQLLPKK